MGKHHTAVCVVASVCIGQCIHSSGEKGADKDLLTQLQDVWLFSNQLVGSLPETWSKLTHVSPQVDLMMLSTM